MDELAQYVLGNYPGLMTPDEATAYKNLIYEVKAQRAEGSYVAEMIRKNWISKEPAVRALLREGPEAFYRRTCERILREHGNEVSLNRCPQCNRLARTPASRQCFACGHDWHDAE
jgi:hypothetical protein